MNIIKAGEEVPYMKMHGLWILVALWVVVTHLGASYPVEIGLQPMGIILTFD